MALKEPADARRIFNKRDGLSVDQAAERIGMHPQTIRNYIKQGLLPATRFGPKGGVLRLHPDDVDDLVHGSA